VRQGERQNVWYILVDGECAMMKQDEGVEEDQQLTTLRPHSHFGERAILRDTPSESSVKVSSQEPSCCLVLDSPTFNELTGLLKNDPAFRHAVEDDLVDFVHYKGGDSTKLGKPMAYHRTSRGSTSIVDEDALPWKLTQTSLKELGFTYAAFFPSCPTVLFQYGFVDSVPDESEEPVTLHNDVEWFKQQRRRGFALG
jgi:CRP-like cAMP-binding protein